jgi:hypothetical protein
VHLGAETDPGGRNLAADFIGRAYDYLQAADRRDFLVLALLARAQWARTEGNFDQSKADIESALEIAQRGSMDLCKADCSLGFAWLYLSRGQKSKARQSLADARRRIERLGYHRRDPEVRELASRL